MQKELKALSYYFTEYESDAGLASNFGSSLDQAEFYCMPKESQWDGPMPSQKAHSSAQEPSGGEIERWGWGRWVYNVLRLMETAGHKLEIEILWRSYGPYNPDISPTHLSFGEFSFLIHFTDSFKSGLLIQNMSEGKIDQEFVNTVKDECVKLRTQAENVFTQYGEKIPFPRRYGSRK